MIASSGHRPIHRITLITGQLDIGGQERALYLLLRGLDRRFDADVVSLSEGGFWAQEIRRLGIPVLELPRRRSWDVARMLCLVRHLRRRRPRLVYSMGFSANTYGRIAGLCARVPRLVTGWRGLEASPLRRGIERLLGGSTDRVICNSLAVLEDVVGHYPTLKNRAVLIVNGVEPIAVSDDEISRHRQSLGAGPGTILVGSIARLSEDKNPLLFLEAAATVQVARPDILFVWIGDGPLAPQVKAAATSLGLTRLHMLGERQDARRLAAMLDVFVLTSHREGMPNAVLEAMTAGRPCVVTAVGGAREVVVDGRTGFVVPPGDHALLAARILELAGSAELRRRLGDAGRARAAAEYAPERMVACHEALFDELLRGVQR